MTAGVSSWRSVPRRWLLVLCGVSFLVLAWDLYALTGPAVSHIGIVSARPDPAFHERIVVAPKSPAYERGLRTGDSIALLRLAAPDRYQFPGPYWGTEPIVLPVERPHGIEMVRVRPVAARHGPPFQAWLGYAGACCALAVATLLAWRRADSPEARLLALFLILLIDGTAFGSNNWITPWPALDAWVSCLFSFSVVAPALLATYALRFAQPAGRTRLLLTRLTYVEAAVTTAYICAVSAGTWYGLLDSFANGQAEVTAVSLSAGLPCICLGIAIARSRGDERTRISWAAGPLAFYYLGQFLGLVAWLFNPVSLLATDIDNVSLFIMPLGLTYALLSRRLLDVGFALNRAAVFAATTLLLAGLFSGLQTLANVTLTNLDRSHNILLQLTIAVVVYYVVRGSRERTNAVVTNLFFSHRERRLKAIRHLPNAVDALDDVEAIGSLVASTLRAQAGISATVFWQSGSGAFVPADGSPAGTPVLHEDGPTIALLRQHREPMHDPTRPAAKAMAFPMLIRGQLRGVLMCEPPAGDGEFAPDEVDAIALLAGRMASARDDLLSESLRKELDRVRNHLQSLEAPAGSQA